MKPFDMALMLGNGATYIHSMGKLMVTIEFKGKNGKMIEAEQLFYIFDPLPDKCILGHRFFSDQRGTLNPDISYRRGALIVGDLEIPWQYTKESGTFAVFTVEPLEIPARMMKKVTLEVPFAEAGDCGMLSNHHEDTTTLPRLPERRRGTVDGKRRLWTWVTNLTNNKIALGANVVIGAFSKEASKEASTQQAVGTWSPLCSASCAGPAKCLVRQLSPKKRGDRDEDTDIESEDDEDQSKSKEDDKRDVIHRTGQSGCRMVNTGL